MECLYDMSHCEISLIVRGYRRRNILQYQLQRMNVWASMFCMGNPHKKLPTDILHLYFDDYDKGNAAISDDEVRKMQQMMTAINKAAKRKAKRTKK